MATVVVAEAVATVVVIEIKVDTEVEDSVVVAVVVVDLMMPKTRTAPQWDLEQLPKFEKISIQNIQMLLPDLIETLNNLEKKMK